MSETLTALAFGLHIAGGTIALFSGTIAAFSPKGRPLHRAAGNVFFVSMLVMGVFAIHLAIVRPGQIANVIGGLLTLYFVATAWLTVRRKEGTIGFGEKFALAMILLICIPEALLCFQLLTGMVIVAVPPIRGPVLIANYTLAALVGIAALSDLRVVLAGGISGAARIARHLWRMCLGFAFATGSAFTNGLPRLLPGPMHVTGIYFLPLLVPVGLLLFWMIRVRLTRWNSFA